MRGGGQTLFCIAHGSSSSQGQLRAYLHFHDAKQALFFLVLYMKAFIFRTL
jgi:hypothetical protein